MPIHKNTSAMFAAVKMMNTAFGNREGDPFNVDANKLFKQCKNIASEYKELMKEFGEDVTIIHKLKDLPPVALSSDDIRDALCDIMVFALGAYHFMGFDADADMQEVVAAVMTRFCEDEEHLDATAQHYSELGIEFYVEGEFPRVCLKSSKDQGDGEYPQGKFLKALGYRKPVFAPALRKDDVVGNMGAERRANQEAVRGKLLNIEAQVANFRSYLEREAFGLPKYDGQANNTGDFIPNGN